MIFVVTGTQFPFDRLAQTIDQWCATHPEREVLGQLGKHNYLTRLRGALSPFSRSRPDKDGIGQVVKGTFQPKNFAASDWYDPSDFQRIFKGATHIIAHAGMGSVLTARGCGIPIMIVPRLVALREHRSDHQVHTANALRGRPGIVVCADLANFDQRMGELLAMERGAATENVAADSLLEALKGFVELGEVPD